MFELSLSRHGTFVVVCLALGCGDDGGGTTGAASGSSTGNEVATSDSTSGTAPGSSGEATESGGLDSTSDGAESTGPGVEGQVVRIATLNIRFGGVGGGGAPAMAEVITASGADIVGLQESFGAAAGIADELGWNSAGLGDLAWVTPLTIVSEGDDSVVIEVCPGHEVVVGNVHLAPFPYGPYDIRDDPDLTEQEVIDTATNARAGQTANAIASLETALAAGGPVFLVGDFNEPSHLDWTQAAADAGYHLGRAIAWPSSQIVEVQGLADTYRTLVPDEVANLGETWTPDPARDEVHDRIDFLYHAGTDVEALEVAIVGESKEFADIVVDPYPTDHRAVVASYRLGGVVCDGG